MFSHDLARDPQYRRRNHLRIKPRLRFPRLWWFRGGRGQGGRGRLAIYSKALVSSAFTATACDLVCSPVHVHTPSYFDSSIITGSVFRQIMTGPLDSCNRAFSPNLQHQVCPPRSSSIRPYLATHWSVHPSVPVIGIFTKLDGRETKVFNEVVGPDPSPSDFLDRTPEVEQKVAEFVNGLETQFRDQRYPPAGFIRIGSMYTLSE
jgi:hypothetical protein